MQLAFLFFDGILQIDVVNKWIKVDSRNARNLSATFGHNHP